MFVFLHFRRQLISSYHYFIVSEDITTYYRHNFTTMVNVILNALVCMSEQIMKKTSYINQKDIFVCELNLFLQHF